MKTLKDPAIFLAQFMGNEAPFDNLNNAAEWAVSKGFKAVQIPSWDKRCIDLELAAESQAYCDNLKGTLANHGLQITELATHLQGQLVAVHPAYDTMFDTFAPKALHGKPKERTEWAIQQMKYAAKASERLGLTTQGSFSGSLLWHTVYPWPQRPKGLVETGFKELAKRWMPIFDYFDDCGVDIGFELHPGEDLHDGITFGRMLEACGNHPRCNILYDPSHFVLQCMDYLEFIDIYHERIKVFHVKDAEFIPSGRAGVYGGYADWIDRPGRFRSLGDGQVDFKGVFSRMAKYDFDGWPVLEWECCMKHPEDGAAEGARFIADHIIRVTDKTFDDFAGGEADEETNKRILGIN